MASSPTFSDRAAAVAALFRSPRWTRDRLRAYQEERLRRIVAHAAARVPFYRGVDANSIRTLDDLHRLPVIGKQDVQRDPSAFLVRGVARDHLSWVMTSGSTGQPIHVCRAMFEERLLQAFRIRAELLLGMRVTDRRAVVSHTGVPRNPLRLPKPTVLERVGVLRRFTHDISSPPGEILKFLRRLRPEVVASYPGGLSKVANEMTEIDRAAIRPRFIVTGAESLRPETRKIIEEAFRAPVYDFYGAHECNLVAWECQRRNGLHVNEDNIILEILTEGHPAHPGEAGDVVITTLHSYAMPLLRFRLGDIAVRGTECSCGLPYSMLGSLQGRSAEVAYRSDGTTVGAIAIKQAFVGEAAWIKEFQLVQTVRGRLAAFVVTHKQPASQDIERVASGIRQAYSLEMTIEVVEELPIRPSGKLPNFVSRLDG
ncbi:MAG TPA: hypothetical protein VER03_02665 [Bryobacteraceae bacterium]|nr:hypothetical protein [Bryobacteraceae bacterium]